MTRDISNSSDIINSRDVVARIEELKNELEVQQEGEESKLSFENWLAQTHTEEADEYRALVALQEEAEGHSEDWRHGATLIRDSYFKDYAQELAADIDAIDRNATWPCNYIDWDEAADELKQDYTQVDFDGVAYWVR